MSDVDQKCGETGTLGSTLGGVPHPSSEWIRGCFSEPHMWLPLGPAARSKSRPWRNTGWWCVYDAKGQETVCLPGGWGSAVFGENTFQTMDTAWGVGGGQGAFDFRKFVMLGNFRTFSPAAAPM